MADIVNIDSKGLSRREMFAAAALQGVLSNPAHCHLGNDELTQMAFELADAMLSITTDSAGH